MLNRIGNTSLFIDGELKTYGQSSVFGGLMAANMSLGARRHNVTEFQIDYDKHFQGLLDEVRIWNLAKTSKQIKMDMNSKLKGTEMGLLAYYPFDKYDFLGENLIQTFEDATGLAPVAISMGSFASNIDVPNIKDARPVQELAFDWVVSTDKIIINVNEQPSAIEKCVLEFTVEAIEDLRENRLESPATWTAYIKQNTVVWEESKLFFEKEVYEDMSFDVNILNLGGIEQNFEISNLPAWIDASMTNGSLAPDSYETIHFTVDPVVNIGNYDVSLFLTSDFGYAEKLNINLKVSKQAPDWTVNASDYQYSMNIIGQLKIDGIISNNPDDMIAAFVNGECRGVAKSTYIADYDMFEVFLTIFSNINSGEDVKFKIWNASEGFIHVNVTPEFEFLHNEVIGTPANPQILETFNSYSFDKPLAKGWTWFSFNLANNNFNDINTILQDIDAVSGNQIKGQTGFANYSNIWNGTQYIANWSGSLSQFDNLSMYMIKLNRQDTLKYWGSKIDVANTEIPLNTGWNWISYTPKSNISVNDAFGGYQPAGGDVVKSQYAFAMYDNAMGWLGSLQYMIPGGGYMFRTSNPADVLIYPESGMKNLSVNQDVNGYKDITVDKWTLEKEQYQNTMSVVAELILDDGLVSDKHIIGAFINGECRGIAYPQQINALGKSIYFLTIYANEDENVNFKLIDQTTDRITLITESLVFASNSIAGEINNPVILHNSKRIEVIGVTEFSISSYPNPAEDNIWISYTVPSEANIVIEMHNVLNQRIAEIVNSRVAEGSHTLEWNTQNIPAGYYIITISDGNERRSINIVKNK